MKTSNLVSARISLNYISVETKAVLAQALRGTTLTATYCNGKDREHLRSIFIKNIDKKKVDSIHKLIQKELKLNKQIVPENHIIILIIKRSTKQ